MQDRGQPSPEEGDNRGVQSASRRRLIAAGIGGAVLGWLGNAVLDTEFDPKYNIEPSVSPIDTRIYRSGETIETPAGNVLIRGWDLLVKVDDLRTPNSDVVQYTLRLRIPKQRWDSYAFTSEDGPRGQFYTDKNEEYVILRGRPSSFKEDENYLMVEARVGDDTAKELVGYKLYPIKFTQYSASEFPGSGFSDVVSETDVDPDILQRIIDFKTPFYTLMGAPKWGTPDVYLRNYESDGYKPRGFDSIINRGIELPDYVFTQPAYENEGFSKLFHLLCHDVIESSLAYRRENMPTAKMHSAYEALKAKAMEIDPTVVFPAFHQREKITADTSPMFTIFSEKTYVPGVPESTLGGFARPYYDYDELFASALTVIRFYPEQFLEKYVTYPEDQKKLIKDALSASFGILKKGTPYHDEEVTKVVPSYPDIKTALGISDINFSK